MKIIISLTKVLILASGLYFSASKAIAQAQPLSSPTSCVASTEQLTLLQPNGTSITLVGKGNLNNHWTETVDGYSVVRNTTGNYEYATKVNGNLSPSGTLANNLANRSFVEAAYASSLTKSTKPDSSPLKGSILSQVARQIQNKTFPTTGNIRVLALLIDYPDLINVIPASDFDSLLYGANYLSGNGSFKTFYETSSGGQLTIDVDVRGWYRATNNFQYYAADSGYDRAADLVREAVNAAEIAGTDFSLYDNDANGSVDGILAVHSGPGAEIGSQSGLYIWSHRWVMRAGNLGSAFYDGVSIDDYMINPETRSATNNGISGIGVFCHEFGHNLGLPDLYDTDRTNGDSEGIGNWCLMAGGAYLGSSNRPSNFSAWCKEELGWDIPQLIPLSQTGTYTLPPASTSRNEIYKVSVPFPITDEYFLIENRQLVGKDSDLPGHGLAIWHINTTKTNSSGNSVNADETLKGVDLEEADGNDDLDNKVNRGDGGDLFPGTSTRTTFDDTTTPSAKDYLLGNTGLQIRNIVETVGGSVSFDFGRVPGPPCAATTSFSTNTGSFDDGSGTGLDYVNNQTCTWLITPATGTVTLSFSAFDIEPTNDTVTVYDGRSITAPLLGRFSGTAIPANLTSTSNEIFIQFKSNATISGPGFDASFITNIPPPVCSGLTNLTAANGNFTDGSGTTNYTNNQNCSWLIQPAGAASITFGLNSLATEIGNDIITVYDGTSAASPILGSFSGTNNLNTFTSSTGSIFVTFITNATITDQGFDAFYTSTTSTAGCSGATTLTATSGSFSDGSMTNNYNNNQFCSWLIQPPSGTVTLSFSAFATEVSFDRVLVFDGVDNTAPQIGSFDGSAIPTSLTSTTNSLYIEFRTNGTITDAGWDASYINNIPPAACSGLTNLTAANGNFTDGSGTANYTNNQNCSWLIQPAGAASITIGLSSLATEIVNDIITVYDGTSAASPILGSFSGTNNLNTFTSSTGSIFVTFITNATITDQGFDAFYTSTTSTAGCSGTTTLTATSGSFSDGSMTNNYNNNQFCSWLIQPPSGTVTLSFSAFATEVSFDKVLVFDGLDNTAPQIGSFDGSAIPASLTSTTNSLYIEFRTNGTITDAGWDASYINNIPTTPCTGLTTITTNTGTFDDGSIATANYADNSNCSWLIQPSAAGVLINLNFARFNTEASNDVVTVYDGTTTADPVLATLSGTNPALPNILSTGGDLLITFVTNASITNLGWEANFTTQSVPPCSATPTVFNAATGTFNDGSAAAADYQNNQNCEWLIQPTGASIIRLDFSRFNTESCCDDVTVHDGTNASAPILGTFRGTSLPPFVTSSGNALFVVFDTDGSVTETGWEASYVSSTSRCFSNLSLTAPTGNLSDGSGTSNYQDNISCSWLIEPPRATSVTAAFINFNVDNGADTLYLYDGTNNSAPLLGKFTGNTNPAAQLATTGTMFIEFMTDGSTNNSGWDLNYTSVIPLSCSGLTTLVAPSGTVEDGSLSGNYSTNLNCTWLIQPPGNPVIINFTMTALDLATAGGFGNRDNVMIYDGVDNTGTLLRQFTRNFLFNPTVSAFSGSMFIEFTTNGNSTAQGWEGTYNSSSTYCVPQTTLTANFGNFSDGSPSGQNYLDNSDCSWLIQPTIPNVAINLQFFQFDTEAANDTVTVYDGASTNDPILATLSGNNPTIPALLSTGGDMLVTFKTNGTTSADGWRANYSTQVIPACSGTTNLTTAIGTFDDGTAATGNYAPNLNCSWLIQPAGASLVSLTFNRFDTQQNGDIVSIYDGSNSSAPLLGAFDGNTVPSTTFSSGSSLFVEFTSNGFFELTGWEASYSSTTSQCFNNLSVLAYSGNIEDGSGANNYQDNLGCSWLIEPPLAATITATFNSFDVSATGDTLFIYDGNSSSATRLAAYTGSILPAAVTATGNEMFVEFITNGNTNTAGWDFDYTTTLNVNCAGTTTFTAATTTFDDGSAVTANYDNNLSCNWLIQPAGNPATITLNMNRFNLSGGFGDRVIVYDNALGSGFPIGQFFGTSLGNPVVSFTGVMFVQFITNASGTSTGWDATYNTSASYCQPNTILTGNTGNFSDGSPFSQNYLNNTDCEWLIQPTTANVAVSLTFFLFDTEITNDTLTVYDGATAASPILGTFSGNTNPPVLTSSGGDMLVTFKSNNSTTAPGWRARYTTQQIPACAGTTTLNAAAATFDDGSGSFANYVDNSNCSWLIAPAGALNINLTFNRFNTQAPNDVVNVYNGSNNSATLIGTYSGGTIPAIINSTGSSLFLEFITDGFNTSSGWEASYASFNTVTLDIQQDTAFINAGAGSTTSLTLTSNVAWTNTDNAAWLIATPVNGSGNSSLNLLAVQPNIGPERSAQLISTATLTADADTVVVIQRSSGRYIDVTPDTLYFAGTSAPNQSANINSNVTWTLAPNQPWIIASPSTGFGSGIPSIMVQNNTMGSIRTSFVLVTGTQNASNDTLWVVQDTAVTSSNPTLSLNKMNITLAQTVASTDVFIVNSNTTWQTTSGTTWLTVTNPAILSDTQTVVVTANSMNTSPLPRASFVAVQDVAGTIFDTVFVFQAGIAPILIGAPDTVLLGANSGSTGVLNIGSSGSWIGIEGNTWFSMSQNSGSGITTLNLTTNSANSTNTRLFSYVALADAVNNLTDTIIVIQDTLAATLVTNPDTVRVGAAVGSSSTFSVSAGQNWVATPSETWITVTPASGNGSGSVSVSADANPGITERIAYVEVSTTAGALNSDTVWVIQESFIASLVVTPSTLNLGFLTGSNGTSSVTSNTSWLVTNPASWLSVSSTSGINDQILTISSTSDNLTGATRTAALLVDGIGAITQTITVNQVDGSSPIFISSKDTVFVDNLQGSTGSFSVLSNANSWTVTENTSWMLINPTSGSQTRTVTALVATRNIFGTTRYANITASSNGFSNFTVVVAQKESNPIFQVAPDSILIGADSSDFKEFNISSNMPIWNISENATWLTISPENGAFTQSVRATVNSQNSTGFQRSTIATITAPPLVPQTIKIVQDTIRTIGIRNNSIEVGLNVYPNPTAGQVAIEFGSQVNAELATVRLFNLLGEEIPISINFSSKNKLHLNLKNQPSGIYFFSIQLNGETVNKKLILTE